MLNENKELKTYYSIAEVAEMFNVAGSLLRYWESMFPNINPQKDAIDRLKSGETNVAEVNHRIEAIDRLKSVRDELQRIGKELQELSL